MVLDSARHAPPSPVGCPEHPPPCHGAGARRRVIFTDDTDRADFVVRLAALAEAGACTIYAWVLLPNHAHLLVRTGGRPLAPVLGIRPQNVYRAAAQGQAAGAEREQLLTTC